MLLSHLCPADHLSLLSPPLYRKPTVGAFVFLEPKMFAGLTDMPKLPGSATSPQLPQELRSLELLSSVSWRKEGGGLAREWGLVPWQYPGRVRASGEGW